MNSILAACRFLDSLRPERLEDALIYAQIDAYIEAQQAIESAIHSSRKEAAQ